MNRSIRDWTLWLVLGLTCLYHLGIGVVSCLAPETTFQFGAWFYDVHAPQLAAQLVYMLKALGMYALFTGGLLLLALRDPVRYRHLIVATAALLVMRATTRLLFFDVLHEAFAVSWGQNLFNVGLLSFQAAVLLWVQPAEETATAPAPAPIPAPIPVLPRRALASASARVLVEPKLRASASGIR